jgi:hypothetical protein
VTGDIGPGCYELNAVRVPRIIFNSELNVESSNEKANIETWSSDCQRDKVP